MNTSADENTETAVLFITSNPINADIILDGVPVLQKTPALITSADLGSHTIGLRKNGFDSIDIEIILEEGKPTISDTRLHNSSLVIDFPLESSISLSTNETRAIPREFRMASGKFNITKNGESLEITPLYPKSRLLSITTGLFTGAVFANIAMLAVENREKGEIIPPHSNKLIVTEILLPILGIAELALLIDRRNYIDEFKVYKATSAQNDAEAQKIFDKAQQALINGKIETAIAGFSNLIGQHPDYYKIPEALYKIARLHIISGDTNLAVSELKIVISNFPSPDVYDKACQTLALLYYNSGEPAKSRQAVTQMVFHDLLFSETKEAISNIGIDQVIENWARNPEGPVQQ